MKQPRYNVYSSISEGSPIERLSGGVTPVCDGVEMGGVAAPVTWKISPFRAEDGVLRLQVRGSI